MKEYFITIVAVALVGAVIISMLPDQSNGKYLKFICGLCAIGCIVFPLLQVGDMSFDREHIADLFDKENIQEQNYGEIYNEAIKNAEIQNAEVSLKSAIIKEVSASEEDFDVEICLENKGDDFYISNVNVKIYPSGLFLNVHLIKRYVEKEFGCQCDIYYEV